MALKSFLVLLIFCCSKQLIAQIDCWKTDDLTVNDHRISILYEHYYSSGGLGSNYQEIRYFIKNKTNQTLRLKIEATVKYTCNRTKTYKLGVNGYVFLLPMGEWDHNSDWVHLEFTNWSNKECIIKLDEDCYTTIEGLDMKISNFEDTDSNSSNHDNNSDDLYTSSSYSNSNQNNCPKQSFNIKGVPGKSCVEFTWMNEATQVVQNDGTMVQNGNFSSNFIFQYKRHNELSWKEISIDNYQFGFTVSNLYPCDTYDARLQRVCSSERSPFTSVQFNTFCPKPHELRATDITRTSATIGGRSVPSPSTCSEPTNHPMRIMEIKSTDSDWIVKVCAFSQDCTYRNLQPNTTYHYREKYQYNNEQVSAYSEVIIFNTLP